MKKILTHLTGIVFVIAILVAGGCRSAKVPIAKDDLSVVIISVKKTIDESGNNHLKMFDSNNPDKVVIDDLYTDVKDGTEVYWVLAENSGLKKIIKTSPKTDGKILPRKAKGIWLFTKYKKHIVPDKQTPNDEQGYYIKVKDEEGNKWEIDPYLRIKGTDQANPSRP